MRIGRVYNVPRVYNDYVKLLDEERDLDAVLVSGPPKSTTRRLHRGCGSHASMNLYPSLRFTPARLVAVADLYEERRERIGRVYNVPRVYDDYVKLLDEERDLDAVLISGPPKLHHEAAIAAMEHGLHVYCEKPPAEDLAGTEEMLEVSRRTGRICMVGFMKRFAQKYAMAKEIGAREEFGRPTHFLLRYSFKTGAGRLRGFLAGMASHAFDLARHFMGDCRRIHALWGDPDQGIILTLSIEFARGHGRHRHVQRGAGRGGADGADGRGRDGRRGRRGDARVLPAR